MSQKVSGRLPPRCLPFLGKSGNQSRRKVPIDWSERCQPIAPKGGYLRSMGQCPDGAGQGLGEDGMVRLGRVASRPPLCRESGVRGADGGPDRLAGNCHPSGLPMAIRRIGNRAFEARLVPSRGARRRAPPSWIVGVFRPWRLASEARFMGNSLNRKVRARAPPGACNRKKEMPIFGTERYLSAKGRKGLERTPGYAESMPVGTKKRPPLSGRPPGQMSVRCGTIRPRQSS